MTHDELLHRMIWASERYHDTDGRAQYFDALRAVVELHKPYPSKPHKPDGVLLCRECTDYSTANYPCATIQAIEERLK